MSIENIKKELNKKINSDALILELSEYGLAIRLNTDANSFFIVKIQGLKFFVKVLWGVASFSSLVAPDIQKLPIMPEYKTEYIITQELQDTILKNRISPNIVAVVDKTKKKVSVKMLESLKKNIKADKSFLNFLKYEVTDGLLLQHYNVLAFEHLDMSFTELLDSKFMETPLGLEIFRSILFQVCYTLYAIRKIYPNFGHCDLHTSNIMLKINKDFNPMKLSFICYHDIAGNKYYCPYFGIMAKIIDFGFSILPEKKAIPMSYIVPDHTTVMVRNDFAYLMYIMGNHNETLFTKLMPSKKFEINEITTYSTYEPYLKSTLFNMYRQYEPHDDLILMDCGQKLLQVSKKVSIDKNAKKYLQECDDYRELLYKRKENLN